MESSWYWRLLLVVALVAGAVYWSLPSVLYVTASPEVRRSKKALKERIPEWLPEKRINLGIDLQGGLHLVMLVDVDKAVQSRTDRIGDEIYGAMEEKQKAPELVRREGTAPELTIVLKDSAHYDELKSIIDGYRETWEIRSHTGTRVVMGMKTEFEEQLKEDAVAQAIKTLRNRIDKYGVTEPEVRKRGKSSILIQIAGLTADEEKSVKEEIIGKTAQLEFKLADDESQYFAEVEKAGVPKGVELKNDTFQGSGDALVVAPYLSAKTKDLLAEAVAKKPPPEDRVVRYERMEKENREVEWRTWLLHRKTPLTGDSLVSAFVAFNQDENSYYVAMNLDRSGASIFDKFTAANVRKRMAIVLDDIVDSAPVIQSRIPNGNVSITLGGGMKSQQEILKDANSLAIVLNAGALPAPVYPHEERTVGATLGEDAVIKGEQAVIASSVLMLLIMLFYYRVSGGFALLAMGVNVIWLFAALAIFGATLTLPGLAGFALTIGMAVDANIIQFERIRDELRLGKTVRAAVDAGFDKAFSAIFDSNATSILACIVLYQYGSGPIRGFATTLAIGLVTNVVAAVIVPRLCLDYLTRAKRVQELSI